MFDQQRFALHGGKDVADVTVAAAVDQLAQRQFRLILARHAEKAVGVQCMVLLIETVLGSSGPLVEPLPQCLQLAAFDLGRVVFGPQADGALGIVFGSEPFDVYVCVSKRPARIEADLHPGGVGQWAQACTDRSRPVRQSVVASWGEAGVDQPRTEPIERCVIVSIQGGSAQDLDSAAAGEGEAARLVASHRGHRGDRADGITGRVAAVGQGKDLPTLISAEDVAPNLGGSAPVGVERLAGFGGQTLECLCS